MSLDIKVVYFDIDLVEIRAQCRTEMYAGTVDLYDAHKVFRDLAQAIRGFPDSNSDRRSFTMGTMDEGSMLGGCRIELYCVDKAGHAEALVCMRQHNEHKRAAHYLQTYFAVEPAAIDRYVAELEQMKSEVGASASLPSVR